MKRKLFIPIFIVALMLSLTACDFGLGGIMGKSNDRKTESKSAPITESIVSDVTEALDENAAIDKEKAKEIALNHAGLKETDISGYRIEYDREPEGNHYDIEFISGGFEYDYEINAENGNIIKSERDIMD